ncbi:MAG TPA: Hsp70 family protein [Rectinemataceae bacterium]|nr:Hsp70 family protein [Rectinemataceae bacterium]
MTMDKIGLKLANGKFYPVLEDGSVARKRLVVTTVQDKQRSVQIDLYRGSGETVTGATYIGSLVVEGIPPLAKGEPDIRMDLGLSDDGTLSAYAEESSTHASQSLKVSLSELSEEQKYEIPDFEFGAGHETGQESSFSDEDFGATDELPSEEESVRLLADEEAPPEEEKRRDRRPLLIALAVVVIILLCLGIAYLVYRTATASTRTHTTVTTTQTVTPPPAAAVPPAAQAAPPPPAPAPAAPAPQAAPPAPKPKPAATTPPPAPKKPGVYYRIKWGDTLWNLSYAFYRNPWYFGRIARANHIKNPDLIIAGHRIWIPPR